MQLIIIFFFYKPVSIISADKIDLSSSGWLGLIDLLPERKSLTLSGNFNYKNNKIGKNKFLNIPPVPLKSCCTASIGNRKSEAGIVDSGS